MFRFCFAALLCLISANPSFARDFSGVIKVIDADTIDVGTTRVRLYGIDAPERAQICKRDGQDWRCGRWATKQVRHVYQGKLADCQRIETDRHGRVVARCFVGGQDMAEYMVLNGIALAFQKYSLDYVDAEKQAVFSTAGIWQSEFQTPAEFRASIRTPEIQPVSGDCRIKGNISSRGRIFHVPGQENYDRTRINTAKGERWFCTAAEARAAGWRAAFR